MNRQLLLAALAALSLSTAPALAQTSASPKIAMLPASSAPAVPSGLKVTCTATPNSGAQDKACPVVQYQGMTTWAYSYMDNRVSIALVTYDGSGRVARNVEKPGMRYVWNAISSDKTKTVLFVGQSNQNITVNWSDLGK